MKQYKRLALVCSALFVVLFASTLFILPKKSEVKAGGHSVRSDISWQRQECRSQNAEAKFFRTQLRGMEPEVAFSLTHHFLWLCKKYRFDPLFVAALIAAESGFNPEAVSPVGAVGLMQIMPTTAMQILERDGVLFDQKNLLAQLNDPFFNLTLGMKYLGQLRDHFHGKAQHFLAAYHGGPARVDDVLHGKKQPLPASQEYVRSIRIGLGLYRLQVPRNCGGSPVHPAPVAMLKQRNI